MSTAAGPGVTPTSTECEQQKQSSVAGDGTVSLQGVCAEQLTDLDENLSASRAHQPTFARSAAVQVKKKTTTRRASHECFSRSTPLRLARRIGINPETTQYRRVPCVCHYEHVGRARVLLINCRGSPAVRDRRSTGCNDDYFDDSTGQYTVVIDVE